MQRDVQSSERIWPVAPRRTTGLIGRSLLNEIKGKQLKAYTRPKPYGMVSRQSDSGRVRLTDPLVRPLWQYWRCWDPRSPLLWRMARSAVDGQEFQGEEAVCRGAVCTEVQTGLEQAVAAACSRVGMLYLLVESMTAIHFLPAPPFVQHSDLLTTLLNTAPPSST